MWPFTKKETKEEIIYKEVEVPKQVLVEKEIIKEVIKEVPVEVRREVITETNIFVPKRQVGGFRRGMWVTSAGRIGILFSFDGDDRAVVHLVNDKGETYEVVTSKLIDIKQARKSQVPKVRRGTIDNFDYPD